MTESGEAVIKVLLGELAAAWNRGDAQAFGARYRAGRTFTNVSGGLYAGRAESGRRHGEIFEGCLPGTAVEMTARKVRFARPGVVLVGVDVRLTGVHVPGRSALPRLGGVHQGAAFWIRQGAHPCRGLGLDDRRWRPEPLSHEPPACGAGAWRSVCGRAAPGRRPERRSGCSSPGLAPRGDPRMKRVGPCGQGHHDYP